MRAILAIVTLVAAMTCFGEVRPQEEVLRRTGGLVAREGRGRLVVVNLQRTVPEKRVREKAAYLSRLLGIRADVSADANARGTVTVVLAEGAKAAACGRGVVDTGVAGEQGFDVAFARTMAKLFVPDGLSTRCPRADIESLFRGDSFTLAARDEVRRLLPEVGFEPAVVATYLTACREGWAPAPTNAFQKAIWERALSEKERGPTNPIRILPPGRK